MGLRFVIVGTLIFGSFGVLEVEGSGGPQMLGKAKADFSLLDVPPGKFKDQLDGLSRGARKRAFDRLNTFEFPVDDVHALNVDTEGDIFYICEALADSDKRDADVPPPETTGAPIPLSPFPSSLAFHSRTGSQNVLLLDMDGHTVSGTAWNNSLGRSSIPVRPFSLDSDYATYSDSEQIAIKRIWQRVAEDYAPYDVDVTTEEPTNINSHVLRVLITRSTDADGNSNPYPTSGGVSYVGYFGHYLYYYYGPSWVYINNISYNEGNIAEAASHEAGHFFGLSHDGQTGGNTYYSGHGSGETSWAPIMGKSYGRNVTQWSKGEYKNANNTQDDHAILAGELGYRPDDHGDDLAGATPLNLVSNAHAFATTPETDPDNMSPENKGVMSPTETSDVWQLASGTGDMSLFINPWISPGNTRGNNLDIRASLLDSNGTVLATSDPTNGTSASLELTVTSGVYYIRIERTSTGDPYAATPTGYTPYGVCGQYFITGMVAAANESAPADPAALTVYLSPEQAVVQGAAWRIAELPDTNWLASGTVITNLSPDDYTVTYAAVPGWTAPDDNPISLGPGETGTVNAAYTENVTTNFSIPVWWLIQNGYTNDPETAVSQVASNGMAVWESFIVGVDPNDPNSALTLNVTEPTAGGDLILSWQSVSGRVYSIYCMDEPGDPPQPIGDAQNLPWPRSSYTNQSGGEQCRILRLHVELE